MGAFPHVLKSSACLSLGCGLLSVVKLCSELRPSGLQTQLEPSLWMLHYDAPKKLFCLPGGGCVCVCVCVCVCAGARTCMGVCLPRNWQEDPHGYFIISGVRMGPPHT